MQQILKKVIRTTSITMCLSVAVAIMPTVTQADSDVTINVDANSSTNKSADVRTNSCYICNLQSVTGRCNAHMIRYYHDVDARACKKFVYGGCGGNENNFQTLGECEVKCGNPPSIRICELQPVTGPCKGKFPRYYHDVDAEACKKFTYGGCAGNQNNFQTLKDCKAKCVNLPSMQGRGTCWKGPACGGGAIPTLLPANCQECKQAGGKSVQTDKGCNNC